jgi:hypothetical protein
LNLNPIIELELNLDSIIFNSNSHRKELVSFISTTLKICSCSTMFYVWAWTYIFLFHCDLHLLKVLNTKWCSPHYVCIMWKEKIEIINGPQREKCIIFLNIFLKFLKFWLQICFDMCFDNLIKHIISLLYGACSTISNHLQECFQWHQYSFF